MTDDPEPILFRATIEKVQTMTSGQVRLYLDLEADDDVFGQLLSGWRRTGVSFEVAMVEVPSQPVIGRG